MSATIYLIFNLHWATEYWMNTFTWMQMNIEWCHATVQVRCDTKVDTCWRRKEYVVLNQLVLDYLQNEQSILHHNEQRFVFHFPKKGVALENFPFCLYFTVTRKCFVIIAAPGSWKSPVSSVTKKHWPQNLIFSFWLFDPKFHLQKLPVDPTVYKNIGVTSLHLCTLFNAVISLFLY